MVGRFVLFVALATVVASARPPIDHVVTVMLENQSFDRMFGQFKGADGILSKHVCNPLPGGGEDCMQKDASLIPGCDPDHGLPATLAKIAGGSMKGFAGWEVEHRGQGNASNYCDVLTSYPENKLPVATWLAQQFALFDGYHASVPGPTWPNRAFALMATSNGQTGTFEWFNDQNGKLLPGRTIFDQLDAANRTWGYYYQTTPWELFLQGVYVNSARLSHYNEFLLRAREGTLPSYSWINPRSGIENFTIGSNDQHPDHDISLGEALLSEIYAAVRSSPQWNRTLLLVTWDEHGGYFDHVAPPPAPSPDSFVGADGFKFDLLGVRVPLLAISPLIAKGTIVHGNEVWLNKPHSSSQLEHSSILATARTLLGLNAPALTARDAWCATFEGLLSLKEARTDLPLTTPSPLPPAQDNARWEAALPLSDLQQDLVAMHEMVSGARVTLKRQADVHPALRYHHRRMLRRLVQLDTQFGVAVMPVHSPNSSMYDQGFLLTDGTVRTAKLQAHGVAYCFTALPDGRVGLQLCRNHSSEQRFVFDGNCGAIRSGGGSCLTVMSPDPIAPVGVFGTHSLTLQSCTQSLAQSFSYYGEQPPGALKNGNSLDWGDGTGVISVVAVDSV